MKHLRFWTKILKAGVLFFSLHHVRVAGLWASLFCLSNREAGLVNPWLWNFRRHKNPLESFLKPGVAGYTCRV